MTFKIVMARLPASLMGGKSSIHSNPLVNSTYEDSGLVNDVRYEPDYLISRSGSSEAGEAHQVGRATGSG